MNLEVDERSSSFFDDIDEKEILQEVAFNSAIVSARSHTSNQVGDHLQLNQKLDSILKDGAMSAIRERLESRGNQSLDREASFYAVEGVQSIADLDAPQDKKAIYVLRVMHCS